jgi:hypothetical protein
VINVIIGIFLFILTNLLLFVIHICTAMLQVRPTVKSKFQSLTFAGLMRVKTAGAPS